MAGADVDSMENRVGVRPEEELELELKVRRKVYRSLTRMAGPQRRRRPFSRRQRYDETEHPKVRTGCLDQDHTNQPLFRPSEKHIPEKQIPLAINPPPPQEEPELVSN